MNTAQATSFYVKELWKNWVAMGQPDSHALLLDTTHIVSLMTESRQSPAQLELTYGGLKIIRAHIQHPTLIKLY